MSETARPSPQEIFESAITSAISELEQAETAVEIGVLDLLGTDLFVSQECLTSYPLALNGDGKYESLIGNKEDVRANSIRLRRIRHEEDAYTLISFEYKKEGLVLTKALAIAENPEEFLKAHVGVEQWEYRSTRKLSSQEQFERSLKKAVLLVTNYSDQRDEVYETAPEDTRFLVRPSIGRPITVWNKDGEYIGSEGVRRPIIADGYRVQYDYRQGGGMERLHSPTALVTFFERLSGGRERRSLQRVYLYDQNPAERLGGVKVLEDYPKHDFKETVWRMIEMVMSNPDLPVVTLNNPNKHYVLELMSRQPATYVMADGKRELDTGEFKPFFADGITFEKMEGAGSPMLRMTFYRLEETEQGGEEIISRSVTLDPYATDPTTQMRETRSRVDVARAESAWDSAFAPNGEHGRRASGW